MTKTGCPKNNMLSNYNNPMFEPTKINEKSIFVNPLHIPNILTKIKWHMQFPPGKLSINKMTIK